MLTKQTIMKSFRLLGKIIAVFLVALGFNSCSLSKEDCIICTDYANDSYTFCKVDFESDAQFSDWGDYVDYLVAWFDAGNNNGCKAKD